MDRDWVPVIVSLLDAHAPFRSSDRRIDDRNSARALESTSPGNNLIFPHPKLRNFDTVQKEVELSIL